MVDILGDDIYFDRVSQFWDCFKGNVKTIFIVFGIVKKGNMFLQKYVKDIDNMSALFWKRLLNKWTYRILKIWYNIKNILLNNG